VRHVLAPVATIAIAAAIVGCSAAGESGAGEPAIVVTTSILGDVVRDLVGDQVTVAVVMPPNTDPHDFQASARQVAEMRTADALIVNGGGFEGGLGDAIDSAVDDGVPTFVALDHVATLPAADDEDGDVDPHFFTDPSRMADAVEALAPFLTKQVPALDTPAFQDRTATTVASLRALDAEIAATLAPVPADRRTLVTNHDVFGYFADRYGFRVIGAVIPSTSTQAEPSAGELNALATTIREAGVPAIFADTASPRRLADALAAEAGDDVRVVELYSESLAPAGTDGATYPGMMRTNAARIAAALGNTASP
jgi:zinc/manganese transport system substrate-binding protein